MLICVPQAVAQTLRSSVGPFVPAPDLKHAVPTAPADDDHTLVWEFGPAADEGLGFSLGERWGKT